MIVAADEANGIGYQNQLLAHLPADLKYFKATTMGCPIIMGRKTFESIGKPLPGRRNLVLSRRGIEIPGVEVFASLQDALMAVEMEEKVFIIGGDSIYKQALPITQKLYLTRIHHKFVADAFFPELKLTEWKMIHTEHHKADEKNAFSFSFETYTRI